MNEAKIIGICNRIKETNPEKNKDQASALLVELMQEIFDGNAARGESKEAAISNLRNMLTWEEVRSCPRAMTNICRSIRKLREKV